MTEIWEDIPNYERLYQVSTLGRVKGLKRKKQLKLRYDKDGYCIVTLCKNNICKTKKVHRLVAETFIPNPKNKETVNHKNGIKADNRLENLEWTTYSENHKHAFDTGLRSNKSQKKKVLMLSLENEPLRCFDSIMEAERITGTYQSSISRCCNGKRNKAGNHKWEFKNKKYKGETI